MQSKLNKKVKKLLKSINNQKEKINIKVFKTFKNQNNVVIEFMMKQKIQKQDKVVMNQWIARLK